MQVYVLSHSEAIIGINVLDGLVQNLFLNKSLQIRL